VAIVLALAILVTGCVLLLSRHQSVRRPAAQRPTCICRHCACYRCCPCTSCGPCPLWAGC
jgi:hypothetical protein